MKATVILLSFFYFFYSYFIANELIFTAIGLSFSLYIFLDFVNKLGKEFPLKEFILLIACFQWIVGAKISYSLGKVHHKYFMYVDEATYMSYVVPGLIAFFIGIYMFSMPNLLSRITETVKMEPNFKKKAQYLIGLGLSSILLRYFFNVSNIAFILYLLELLLYIGIAYLFYAYPQHKIKLFIGSLAIVFFTSLTDGMFHKLLLIASFFLFYIFNEKVGMIPKLLIILFGFVFIYVLQTVKKDFREVVWNSQNIQNPGELFLDLVKEEFLISENQEVNFLQKEDAELENQSNLNNRLNQGWIISKTLDNVPKNQDYLRGKTIKESVFAAILPRFLFPEKAGAEKALENFKSITGLALSKSTSMGLSIIAEFYANFGKYGGWLAMLIYGCFIALVIRFIIFNLGSSSPLILIWFILFFFQVVKAETDFIKIFNHLVKSIIFYLIVYQVFVFLKLPLFQQSNK